MVGLKKTAISQNLEYEYTVGSSHNNRFVGYWVAWSDPVPFAIETSQCSYISIYAKRKT